LAAVIKQTFGTLVTLATNLLNSPPAGAELEIPVILHLIELILIDCTGFIDASTEHGESRVLGSAALPDPESLLPCIPADVVPTDEEERERSEWWKVKKWVCWILVSLPKFVLHPGQARAMAVGPHRLHSHLNWYFPVAMGTLVLADPLFHRLKFHVLRRYLVALFVYLIWNLKYIFMKNLTS
jgi:hypothetical protein